MQPHDFLQGVRAELARRGVIGSHARELLEEWDDHLRSKIGDLRRSGLSVDEAHFQAMESFGMPQELAEKAALQKAVSTWQGRHPIYSSSAIGILLICVCLAAMWLSSLWLTGLGSGVAHALAVCLNWTPWILGLGWLVLNARAMPAGWKGYGAVLCWTTLLALLFFSFSSATLQSDALYVSFGLGVFHTKAAIKLALTLSIAIFIWRRAMRPLHLEAARK